MIIKPNIGEVCNGCGLCCMAQVCLNGSFVLKLVDTLGKSAAGPCPAIERLHNGKIVCGIITNPNKHIKNSRYPAKILSKHFAHLIGSGTGCDELLDDDTEDEELKLDALIEQWTNNSDWEKKTKMALKIIHGNENF